MIKNKLFKNRLYSLNRYKFIFGLIGQVLILSSNSYAEVTYSSEYTPIILKKGDTISEILKKEEIFPLYGQKGQLKKTLKVNRLKLSSSKKLPVGEIILIPKKRVIIQKAQSDTSQNEKERTLSENKFSSKDLSEQIKSTQRLNTYNSSSSSNGHIFDATLKTLYQTYQFKKSDGVEVAQNFNFSFRYKKIDSTTGNTQINPFLEASLITQSQASFEDDSQRSADFDPSYQASVGSELYFKHSDISVSGVFTFENFSRLFIVGDNKNNFEVRSTESFWAQLNIEKFIRTRSYHYFFGLTSSLASNLGGEQLGGVIGLEFNKSYRVWLEADSYSLDLGEESTLNTYALSLGHRW